MSITTVSSDSSSGNSCLVLPEGGVGRTVPVPSRYESQKRRDWNTFGQYLKNHRPPLELSRCSGAHVLEFLRYLDQFGKTKVHNAGCPFFGHPHPPVSCSCPLRQAWGSLDALIGRLRAAFEENGGQPEANPFAARAVRLYLREVRDTQAKARGITYEKKKRKKTSQQQKSQQERQPLQGQLQPHHRNQHDHTLHLHHHHHQQQQQQQQTIHHHLPLAGDQMGLPSSQMVDLNLDNGGYPNPPHHLFFHGHVLIPPTDAGCHISMPSTAPSNVGTAGNLVVLGGGGGGSGGGGGGGNRSAGSLFSPERLLLCEM